MLEDKAIMVVDDDLTLLQMYEERIKQEGAIVVTAQDGAEVFQKAEESRPQVILLDLMMPSMNGFDVLKQLKANDSTKDIPVIVFTALADENKKKTAMDLGAEEYMVKSEVLPVDVVEKVKSILAGH